MLDSIMLDSIMLDSIMLDSIMLDSIMLDSIMLDSIMLDSIMLDSMELLMRCVKSISQMGKMYSGLLWIWKRPMILSIDMVCGRC